MARRGRESANPSLLNSGAQYTGSRPKLLHRRNHGAAAGLRHRRLRRTPQVPRPAVREGALEPGKSARRGACPRLILANSTRALVVTKQLQTWTILATLIAAMASSAVAAPVDDAAMRSRIERVLSATPVIDGHNDLPAALRHDFPDQLWTMDLSGAAASPITKLQTDIARLKKGHVGGQFWSVWIPGSMTGAEAVKATLEQIDIARGFTERYPQTFAMAGSAADIEQIQKSGRIASLLGVEGGHQMGSSISVLRQYYGLGVRYMTLTHTSNNELADSATDNPVHKGLTPFGRAVVEEMNRLGMLVDVSHVSPDSMRQAIALSRAPVIFSHSGARAVCEHPRNVPDDVLKLVAERDGIVMVNFYSGYVSNDFNRWSADLAAETARYNSPPYDGIYIGQPDLAAAALARWKAAHPKPVVTTAQVADHIEHIVKVAGIDHVGMGSDFDGIDGEAPEGLQSVADFPNLFVELARRGWSDDMLAQLAGRNLLRVMRKTEAVAADLKSVPLGNPSVADLTK